MQGVLCDTKSLQEVYSLNTDVKCDGWLISYPDLPGCISDGESPEEAIANGADALNAWMVAAKEGGRDVAIPGEPPGGKLSVTH